MQTGKSKTKLRQMPFQVQISPIFGEMRSETRPMKVINSYRDVTSKNKKKEIQTFFGIIDYISKFSPSTADICESLRQLISRKTDRTWNATYQELFHKAKMKITESMCTKFYDETKPLYLETEASGIGLRAALLQTRSATSCPRAKAPDNSILRTIEVASKSLSGAERRYSNIEREALAILHRLDKFHHYCFVRDVSIITDHKPLVAIFKKEKADTFKLPQNTSVQSKTHM